MHASQHECIYIAPFSRAVWVRGGGRNHASPGVDAKKRCDERARHALALGFRRVYMSSDGMATSPIGRNMCASSGRLERVARVVGDVCEYFLINK